MGKNLGRALAQDAPVVGGHGVEPVRATEKEGSNDRTKAAELSRIDRFSHR